MIKKGLDAARCRTNLDDGTRQTLCKRGNVSRRGVNKDDGCLGENELVGVNIQVGFSCECRHAPRTIGATRKPEFPPGDGGIAEIDGGRQTRRR